MKRKAVSAALVGTEGNLPLKVDAETRKEGEIQFISGLPMDPPAGEAAWEIRVKLGAP
jgi:hypothetical protein